MGQHILFAFKGMSDKLPLKPGMHVGVIPCGWCGREGQCQVQLVGKEKSYSVISSCPYHYSKMSYTRALQPNKSSPCTNVPIHCPICSHSLSGQPRTIWKYNAMNHFITEHKPASHSRKLTEISPSLWNHSSAPRKRIGSEFLEMQSRSGEMSMRSLIQMALKKSLTHQRLIRENGLNQ